MWKLRIMYMRQQSEYYIVHYLLSNNVRKQFCCIRWLVLFHFYFYIFLFVSIMSGAYYAAEQCVGT